MIETLESLKLHLDIVPEKMKEDEALREVLCSTGSRQDSLGFTNYVTRGIIETDMECGFSLGGIKDVIALG